MASYGISRAALIANTGIELAALDDPAARMTHQQKICFFAMCNACQLTRELPYSLVSVSAFQILVCSAMRSHLQPLWATLSPSALDTSGLPGRCLRKAFALNTTWRSSRAMIHLNSANCCHSSANSGLARRTV